MTKVFSIEEFSTFNGPGIRTTVFLKGCPLRCAWCHNPEGQSFETEYMRNTNGCLNCGKCIEYADKKQGGIHLTSESAKHCPKSLIRQSGIEYTAEELAEKILKNERILKANNGGVTFSGGEPLAHLLFIKETVSLLGNLSVAIQTSGFADQKVFTQSLSLCDYMLFDLKLFDNASHLKYCGGENRDILENYKILAKSGKEFVTRIPLIPNITDKKENLEGIANFMQECGVSYVEVLPYNQFAGSKYLSLMREDIPVYEMDSEMKYKDIFSLFEAFGIKSVKM